jgi:uncharacterized protein YmfQ (DUF2313 family)
MDAFAYARMLRKLLPPGLLWRTDPDAVESKAFVAMGDELVRVEQRGDTLIEESDPRTAVETLDSWETILGLPDEDVTAVPSTTAERQLAVTQKFIRRGGQRRAYFIELAAACGYTVTIQDAFGLTVFRAGRGRCGDRIRDSGWAHYWTMTVQPAGGVALSTAELERIIRRAAPAHTVVGFVYV